MAMIRVVRTRQAAIWNTDTDTRNREVHMILSTPNCKDLRSVVRLEDSTLLLDEDGDVWHLNLAPSPYSLRVELPHKVKQLTSNGSAVVMLTDQGTMFAWGEDRYRTGVFGIPRLYSAETPVEIECPALIMQVALGETHAAALDSKP